MSNANHVEDFENAGVIYRKQILNIVLEYFS